MSALTIPSDEAFAHLKNNLFAKWPARGINNRIEPICKPGFEPQFHFDPGEKVFTIGSCFARHIEDALAKRGFDVVSMAIKKASRHILNNFSVPSMLNEIEWALDPAHPFSEEDNFFELMRDRYIDIHLQGYIRPTSLEDVREKRKTIIDVTRRVVECSSVVMTLGLVEVWYDTRIGRYLNNPPPKSIASKHPGRFELHQMDYDTTLAYMRRTIATLKKYCRDDQKILLTVSPVPLVATFTDQDVILANCYSKSLLRVVAETVTAENPHISYYPSYESVTLSERRVAWQDDQHHVSLQLIQTNVDRMIDAYVGADGEDGNARHSLDVAAQVHAARVFCRDRNFASALGILERVADQLVEPEDRLLYAQLAAEDSRFEAAHEALASLEAEVGGWLRQVLEARVLAGLGRSDEAIPILRAIVDHNPRRTLAFRAWVDVLRDKGAYDEAVDVLYRWSKSDRSVRVFAMLAEIYVGQGKTDAAIQVYETAVSRDISHAMVSDPASINFYLDFAELLIDQKRLDRAREILGAVEPASPAQVERLERLKAFAQSSHSVGAAAAAAE